MKKSVGRIFGFFEALSLKTYLWSFCTIFCTLLLCQSFFMVEPLNRQIFVSGKAIESGPTATDLDDTLIVRSLSFTDQKDPSKEYNYALLMDNSISEKQLKERAFEIRTGSAEDEVAELSQASDDPAEARRQSREELSARYTITEIAEGDLPPEELVSSNATVSIADYLALCQLVEAEAESEDTYGKRLVANVVLNRLNSARYPDEIENVILDEGQFKPVGTGIYYKTVPTEEAKYAVMTALNGEDDSRNALFFQRSASSYWGGKTYLFRYGSHSFYR